MIKEGTRVKIKDNLQPGKKYGIATATKELVKYSGELVTISYVGGCKQEGNTYYHIEEDDGYWYWTAEMFDK